MWKSKLPAFFSPQDFEGNIGFWLALFLLFRIWVVNLMLLVEISYWSNSCSFESECHFTAAFLFVFQFYYNVPRYASWICSLMYFIKEKSVFVSLNIVSTPYENIPYFPPLWTSMHWGIFFWLLSSSLILCLICCKTHPLSS